MDSSDWANRLKEARAKREMLLSKAGAAEMHAAAKHIEPVRAGDGAAPVDDTCDVRPEVAVQKPRRDISRRFVFAAGVVLGMALGAGVSFGFVHPKAVAEQAAAQVQAPVVPASVSVVIPDRATPEFIAEPPAASRDVIPEYQDVLVAPVVPVAVAAATPVLPVVSPISRPRRGAVQGESVNARSLPQVLPTRESADTPYSGNGPSAQVFMHAPDGLSAAQLQAYVADVEQTGVEVVTIGREGFRVSTTHLRFYSPDTATKAAKIAGDLGIEARDFSSNTVNAERIELWVAGWPKASREVEPQRSGFFARLFKAPTENAE
ncbi:hypothetical protein [Roseobacter sp.]|uniref:hypothetical protein n=1 Tax=Roseobacter sp. TaxID=1907202 RepID=UPI0032990381